MTIGPIAPLSVTVCVLNWNCGPFLEACLEAIQAQTYPNKRIVLIDNGSTDGSVDFVRERFPDVTIKETGRNLGYGAGNNVALRELTSDIAFLLNPDVVLSADCLAQLVDVMATDPRIGIAGCKLWYPGGEMIQHAGGFIAAPQAFPGHFGIRELDRGQYDTLRDVDYVIGAAFAIRRETLAKVGLFDEGIFLYFEDVDLCYRARRAGYRVTYVPAATAIHVESATTQPGSFGYLNRFHVGRWYLLLKHYTVEQLVSKTFPAEGKWLETLDFMERRAVAIACRATLYNLPTIAAARAREGVGSFSEKEWPSVENSLLDLIRVALTDIVGSSALADLGRSFALTEPTYTSRTPVIGPALATFRKIWNDVAGRWYVDYLRHQQTSFNQAVLAHLRATDEELVSRQIYIETQMLNQLSLRRRVLELETQLREKRS